MSDDEIQFRWFGDVCIRVEEIVAFQDDINAGTRVLLRNGREVTSRLDPIAFASEFAKVPGHD